MTTSEKSAQDYSPTTAPQDQEVSLVDQIRYVADGHKIDDVAHVAMGLLAECCMVDAPDKETALANVDFAHRLMRQSIETNFWQHRLNSLFFRWKRQ